MLEVSDLHILLRKSNREIVKGVSFSISDGEALGLIGESGSVKSMTGKCITGLLNRRLFKSTGSLLWNGGLLTDRVLEKIRGNEICMIPQNPMTAFAPMLRLGRQLEMGFDLKGKKDRGKFYERLDETFQTMKLPDTQKIVRSFPSELSGGMLQRVMICLALMKNPGLVIADEATTAVDAVSEYHILRELKLLRNRGVSLLVVTHDFGVASCLCDRVAVMKEGKIVEREATDVFFKNPRCDYARRLVEAACLVTEGPGRESLPC